MPNAIRMVRPGYYLATAAILLALVVVVLGAFTRLVDAGLGCPDWPGCYGHLTWPDEHHEIAKAEAAFPDSPVDTDKTWPEMVHRYCASLLGLVIIGLNIIGWRARKTDGEYPFGLCVGLLLLVICQGAFGAWTVTLKLWPQVVTAHLLGGFSLLTLLWLLRLRLAMQPMRLNSMQVSTAQRLKPWVWGALAVVIVQIVLGGWTSSNYAALACPDFPTCQGQWLPPTDFSEGFNFLQHIGPNYLGGQLDNDARVAIHLSHRIGAIVVSVYVVLLGLALWRSGIAAVRRLALVLWVILALQVSLGISNIIFSLPLPVAVAHNAGGAILLLTLVTVATRLYYAARETNNNFAGQQLSAKGAL
ncbi:COX15/CtaA family protein [Porticoccaceae bacterium LTM1]|nr:COX15/CtaA family protein [Porticoccaceae bacterium LTM1]